MTMAQSLALKSPSAEHPALAAAADPRTMRLEATFERSLLRLVGSPYRFGGRGKTGIDCSSVMMRAIRDALRVTVAQLPWMTANQIGIGRRDLTIPMPDPEPADRCALAFFDWDEDGIYEHICARLIDGSWVWASSTVGQVVHVDVEARKRWRRQWREIEGSLYGPNSTFRLINWHGWHT
jgi:cell wall-associated NlpC family hydrolase